jgi:hypothetical protein
VFLIFNAGEVKEAGNLGRVILKRQAMYVQSSHCCRGKGTSIKYYECVFLTLATRMCSIILSCVASPALPCFSELPHKRHDFRGEKNYLT